MEEGILRSFTLNFMDGKEVGERQDQHRSGL
jgi:hypothetical protein